MKVVVGTNTIVKKITVGTPIRVGSAANGSLTGLDDVNGTINLSDGTILQYDSNAGVFKHVTPASVIGSGLTVQDSGLGSLTYDSSNAILTYTGPSADSIHSLFNATYDSNSLGTLSYTNGTVRLVGPTAAQIRALFSAGNSLNYNEATGEFSVTVPDTSASFDSDFATKTTDDLAEGSTNLYFTDSRGRAAISVIDAGGFGSLAYNGASGQITYTGPSVSDVRSVINVGENLAYDSTTGKITFTGDLDPPINDSDVRALFSVTSAGDIGSLSYNAGSGEFTFVGVNDSDVRGLLTAAGDLSYNPTTGQFSFTQRTDEEVRGLFNAGTGITYDSATGKISTNVGIHYQDSDARKAISVTSTGDIGSLSYNAGSGEFTFIGVNDSDVRDLISATGDLSYNSNTGVISFTQRTDEEVRGLFNAGVGIIYDSTTGKISTNVGIHYQDSDARKAISVTSTGDIGSLSYDNTSGEFTFVGVNDSDVRGLISATGDLSYNSNTGVISFTERTDEEVRGLFNAGTGITYDSTTGKISTNVGIHYQDSDARKAISVVDVGGLGALSYDNTSGELTFTGVSDSDVRGLISATGDLSYNSNTGVISFTERTDAQIRALFNVSGDLGYDTATGVFSIDLGSVDVTDSAVTRALLSATNTGGGYGSLTYDTATGRFTYATVTDSDIRGSFAVGNDGGISGLGQLTYDSATGRIAFQRIQPFEIRSLFSAAGDIQYDSSVGRFSLTVGAHYQDSDARHAINFIHTADSIRDVREYGGVTYNKATGLVTISGTTDSDIRGSISVQDSGGLGSLTYNEQEGRIIYRGPDAADIWSTFAVNEDSTSLGNLYFDSAQGRIAFQLDQDSVRRLISVVSDNQGGTHLSYDHSTGIITYRGPSTLNIRNLISIDSTANIGDGSLLYDESTGVFTYVGPVAAETRKHFAAGNGLDYDSGTGTFRVDSDGDIRVRTFISTLLVDTPLLKNYQGNININPYDADSADSNGIVNIQGSLRVFNDLTVNGNLNITGDSAVFNVGSLSVEDPTIAIGKDIDVDDSAIDNAGLTWGRDSAGGEPIHMLYDLPTATWQFNRGLNIDGTLTATNIVSPTVTSLQQQIDALPDSAQTRNLFSAGPGLSYDNINGIFRITSSGVVAGTYGTQTTVPQITVDSLGQIDSIGVVAISTIESITFDSTTGQITLVTATDSYHTTVTLDPYSTTNLAEGDNLYYTRARFDSALGDNVSRTQIRSYIDSAATTESFKDTVRGYFSVNDQGGQGALTYDSDTGQITYTGAVIRKAGRGLDLDSDTGTFRIDSTADVIFNSVVATTSITTDSAYVNRLNVDSAIKIAENGYIEFTPTDYLAAPARLEGRMWYDEDAKTIAFYGDGDSHINYVNERLHVRVRNSSGNTIPRGAPVYITGVHISGHPIHGHHPTVDLADASDVTKKDVIGVAGEDIANGAHGYVIKSGYVDKINTSNLTEGQRVHLGFSTPGSLTALAPEYPNYPMDIGTCLTVDSFNGTILVEIFDHTFERIRVTQSAYIDGNLTVAGDLNIQGSQTTVNVASLNVADNFIYLAGGDTVTSLIKDSASLNDLTFTGHYTGDSSVTYFVRISGIDGGHDDIQWSFDSTFNTLEPFESDGGPTTYHLSNTLPVNLKYGISVDFEAITGHKIGDAWQGQASPTNLQLGIVGNYNTPTMPYSHTGVFRDIADGRWKFFEGYRPEIDTFIDVSDSTYADAAIQFSTGYGNIVGNLTGNVTGQVSDISNHTTADLAEDPAATDSSGTMYFTAARARSSIFSTDAGGDGSFTYDSITGEMVYTGPSEAEFYQHFKDNADSWGDATFDSSYGTNGGFKLHERHILRHGEVFSDSWINANEYFLVYSGTTGGLKKVSAATLASTIGGEAGANLFGFINL